MADTTNVTATKKVELVIPAEVAQMASKSEKIRALIGKYGWSRSQVANVLGIRYQHVRNVIVTPLKKPDSSGVTGGDPNMGKTTNDARGNYANPPGTVTEVKVEGEVTSVEQAVASAPSAPTQEQNAEEAAAELETENKNGKGKGKKA
jgi:hypothetical protein